MFIDQCKLTKQDRKDREEILKYLQNEFKTCYPSCSVHAYGSSHNGFGLRNSDLDVCVILKDYVCFFVVLLNLLFDFNFRMKNLILLFWKNYLKL
jgi:DNA polymerase sigma